MSLFAPFPGTDIRRNIFPSDKEFMIRGMQEPTGEYKDRNLMENFTVSFWVEAERSSTHEAKRLVDI